MLTARTKTIERTGTGRQFPPSLASLSATKFSLQIYMELTAYNRLVIIKPEQAMRTHSDVGLMMGDLLQHARFWLCIYSHRASWKILLTTLGMEPANRFVDHDHK